MAALVNLLVTLAALPERVDGVLTRHRQGGF